MLRVLLVDQDEAARTVIRGHLSDTYQIIETAFPDNALTMAMEHKPHAILLDLSFSGMSGFELCHAFSSQSLTPQIPIFLIGQDERNRVFSQNLGASGYFTKPVDFAKLKKALAYALASKTTERRTDVRIGVKVTLTLKGRKRDGTVFEADALTKNMSKGGFLCACPAWLQKGDTVQVFFADECEHCLGDAQVVRVVETDDLYPDYGFQFIGTIIEGK